MGLQVLYLEPALLSEWDARDGAAPRAARWVVFRDPALRASLLHMHATLATGVTGLELDEAALTAVQALRPHLRPGPAKADTRREHAAVRRALAHLTERWDQPVALADLVEATGLSRFALHRRFRAQIGLTPHGFQTNLRVDRARALLRDGQPLARVAADCGFADQAHLTRTFRRLVGITPGRYAAAA